MHDVEMQSSFTGPGAGRGEWWGSTFASSTVPFSSLPGLAVELLELEAVHWVLDSEARMRQDVAE